MNQDVFTHIEELEVVPGNFEVIVTVADSSSGRAVTRESEASIPDPDNPQINLTTVRLLGIAVGVEEEAPFFAITTYTDSLALDRLVLTFQVTNTDLDSPLEF